MFEGYHAVGGFQDDDDLHRRLRIDQNLEAAQYSLACADRLYALWRSETDPVSRSKLTDTLRREFAFTNAFYRQVRTDLADIDPDPWTQSPLRTKAWGLKNDLDDLTLRLEMDKIVPDWTTMKFSPQRQS